MEFQGESEKRRPPLSQLEGGSTELRRYDDGQYPRCGWNETNIPNHVLEQALDGRPVVRHISSVRECVQKCQNQSAQGHLLGYRSGFPAKFNLG